MLSDIIAIIALILSITSLYWQWREKRPHLKVTPSIEVKSLSIGSNGQGGFAQKDTVAFCVYLANPSEKPVHVTAVHLYPQKGKEIPLGEFDALYQRLFRPFTIEPLRGHTFTVWGQTLVKALQESGFNDTVEARVIVKDEVNKQYKSKSIRFSINQLRESQSSHETDAA